ncbi:uncharacterized protein [Linepithema humile]|uniref:uncharacterized protein n=1 Tax=Linepithema humile TaxID=83485 RepID=UPI000623159A|nr:PREDICTED: uncharacterized protein LOC105673690 [Linepithema humile]XP_012224920.1 PREDICTED: uncharacterized protein LOC105673690 [Linepithema humile]XP_012224921.1 PREDICTED: uncharacterized protein LOC105673690 [Linepithema humile]
MSADHHSGKGYAPLPQSISNTDTEDEEEHLTQSNDIAYVPRIDNNTIVAELHSNHENGMFYPLDETRNVGNNARNRQNTIKYYQDDIPIMVIEENQHDDFWKRRNMSYIRRFCLLASVLLCIVTIIIFLYVLPCDNSMVCPSIIEPQSSVSWDKSLQGIEIHGPITIIPASPYNLIFLLRGEHLGKNDTNDKAMHQRQIPSEGGGVMSMQGNSGLPLWLVPLKRFPTNVDCTSIDIDRSGKPDCIVTGEQGLLVSIEPIAGTIHWSSTSHTFSKLPVILPDIDADNIEDLLSVTMDNANVSSLVFLSGKTGQLLGRYSIHNCTSVDIYNLVSNGSISYSCYDGDAKYVTRFMSLNELFRILKTLRVRKDSATELASLPRLFEMVKFYEEEYSWKPTPYHRLTIENEGICPGQFCRASVNLTLQKITNEPITIWDHVSSNAFASKPAFLITSGKPYTSGFAIKFWQWIDSLSGHMEKTTVTERRLVERVLIVFVNYTDVQTINASQSDVVQLCHGLDCQPNLNLRKQFSSIAVEYINNDEFPELISYWSSYDADSTKGLTSKVQVIKMDSVMFNLLRGNV